MAIAQQLEAWLKEGQFQLAETAALDFIAECPESEFAHRALAHIYLWTLRELEAFDHVLRANDLALSQHYVDTLACRALLASHTQTADPEGVRLIAHATEALNVAPTPGLSLNITACLIVKNEENYLADCLESLKGWVQEVVVVDTGSTDQTVKIAEAYGAKIGSFAWINDFAAARNASIALASNPWILWIDADERLAVNTREMLWEATSRPQFGGFMIDIVNDMGSGQSPYVHSPVRLFRNLPEIRFEGRIHEQISPSIIAAGLQIANLQGMHFLHLGYTPELMIERDKCRRTIDLLEQQVAEEPENPFPYFNLANTYASEQRWNEVVQNIESCLTHVQGRVGFGYTAFHLLVSAHRQLGNLDAALQAHERADDAGYPSVLTTYELACAYADLGQFSDAKKYATEACAMEWNSDLAGDFGVMTTKRTELLGRILAELGETSEALAWLEKTETGESFGLRGLIHWKSQNLDLAATCFEAASHFPATREEAINQLVKLSPDRNPQFAAEQLVRLVEQDPDAAVLRFALGDALARLGAFAEAAVQYQQGLTLAPDHSEGWFVLGNMVAHLGANNAAIRCYDQCLLLDPNHASAMANKATLTSEAA